MKTTLELPDTLYKAAKIKAVQRGISLKTLLTEILARELEVNVSSEEASKQSWMKYAGALKHLPKEVHEDLDQSIQEAFGKIDNEMCK